MSEETRETAVVVSGAEIKKVLTNPEAAFNTLEEFCDDITTLTVSMHNLYEQHPIEFSLLGVQVEVIVRSNGMGKELLHHEFGCKGDIHEILKHPVSEEEVKQNG
jgi:hypothetical protein